MRLIKRTQWVAKSQAWFKHIWCSRITPIQVQRHALLHLRDTVKVMYALRSRDNAHTNTHTRMPMYTHVHINWDVDTSSYNNTNRAPLCMSQDQINNTPVFIYYVALSKSQSPSSAKKVLIIWATHP